MEEELEKSIMITKIDKVISDVHKNWYDLNIYDIEMLKDSWNDPVCKEYVEKIQNIDNTISRIISNLELLKSYWKKYNVDENTTKGDIGNE